MKESDVIELYCHLRSHGVDVVIDGGWGVDALLGHQTRVHSDLDIAMLHDQVFVLRELLAPRGYRSVPRPGTTEWNFVLGDEEGRQVDVHSFTFDPPLILDGFDAEEVPDDRSASGVDYPRRSLYGRGEIAGVAVRCIPAIYMVSFHTGYALDEDDYRDVRALCERYGIEVPAEFETFKCR